MALLVTLRADASSMNSVVLNGTPYSVNNIITRDVAIVGGGATGTYSAIRLKDQGKTVVVIEGQDRLGGHTQTYHDPETGRTIDYGVVVWHNLAIVKNFFDRLNVSLAIGSLADVGIIKYMDFQTGKLLPDYTPSDPTAALGIYAEQLAKYPYVESGFNLPYPVPVDLLLPFGEFVTKYHLEDMVGLIFTFAQGLGDILTQPTIYIFKNFGSDILKDIQIGFLTTAEQDNSLLYEHALADLGQNVVLNSEIIAVDRSGRDCVQVLVKTPPGITLVRSRRIVFTIPPKIDNLRGWDLDHLERSLFGQFSNSGYYTAIIRHSGVPDNLTIINVSNSTLYGLAPLPAIYKLSPTGVQGLLNAKFGSAQALADSEVEQQILSSVKKLQFSERGPSDPEVSRLAILNK